MSDSWVGPGWWMASDGKWYPPRTQAQKNAAPSSEPTRWSRRALGGDPIEGATGLSDTERAASRAERAALIPRPGPVSIKRLEDIDELSKGNDVDVPSEPIDLRDNIDLRDSANLADDANIDLVAQVDFDAQADFDGQIDLDVEELQPAGVSVSNSVEADAEMVAPPDAATRRSNEGQTQTFASERPSESASTSNSGSGGWVNGSILTDSGAEQGFMESSDEGSSAHEIDQDDSPRKPGPALIQHAVLPALIDRESEPEPRRSSGLVLLSLATILAVLSGVLGAFWLRERSAANDLRAELDSVSSADDVSSADLVDLNSEVRTLRFQNEELQTRLDEMSALVLELPAGRLTEIVVPFTPVFADEVVDGGRERLIAVSSDGEYAVWADGADGSITGAGSLTGGPTGLFAATSKAWITTDAATIDVVSLLPDGEGLPTVNFGPVSFVAPEERAYWTYESESGSVVRLKKSDGSVTASARVPVPVIDLTIGAGSVWALGDDGRVYRINTADFTVQPIDAGADLISITAGPDALWTLSAADGSLRRVDAVSGEVLVTVPVGRDPVDATFAGSSVWVALRSGTSLIEVDTRTAAVISRTALPGEPTALHQGDSGVFVTLEGQVPLVRVASLALPAPSSGQDQGDDAVDAG